MKKLLQINVTANWGSTGRIAEQIGLEAIGQGWSSSIAYGRKIASSQSELIKIGTEFDTTIHWLSSRLYDSHGLQSKRATRAFIKLIDKLSPDIIHLHNIHGYYINFEILFEYLRNWGGPVVWTMHDCWPFTGHCAFYGLSNCKKWEYGCSQCPQSRCYPKSFRDNSERNYLLKKKSFTSLKDMTIVPVSNWLSDEISNSFLSKYPVTVIHNGVDTNLFKPIPDIQDCKYEKIILGVASIWDARKGLNDFCRLRKLLPPEYKITLVGLSKKQITELPQGITGISRTDSIEKLVDLYNTASVFVNPTYEDNFPTTNIEALACGIPVVTYNTGGSAEAIDSATGISVPTGSVELMRKAVVTAIESKKFTRECCRTRALINFNSIEVYRKYMWLYEQLIMKC